MVSFSAIKGRTQKETGTIYQVPGIFVWLFYPAGILTRYNILIARTSVYERIRSKRLGTIHLATLFLCTYHSSRKYKKCLHIITKATGTNINAHKVLGTHKKKTFPPKPLLSRVCNLIRPHHTKQPRTRGRTLNAGRRCKINFVTDVCGQFQSCYVGTDQPDPSPNPNPHTNHPYHPFGGLEVRRGGRASSSACFRWSSF